MILTDEESNARLGSKGNLVNILKDLAEDSNNPNQSNPNVQVIPLKEGGRKLGDVAIPVALRSLIGRVAVQGDETQRDIAQAFGISQPSVGFYANGLAGDRIDHEISEDIAEARGIKSNNIEEAHNQALDAMVGAIGGIKDRLLDPDQLAAIKTRDLSRIASDMNKIVSGAKQEAGVINNTKVIVYAPLQRREDQYETIKV